jgi:predicted DsbA family dithiol-disulfide isomerase
MPFSPGRLRPARTLARFARLVYSGGVKKTTIPIDIVSDLVCPWCLIGYKRLERALDGFSKELSFDLRWHPFELNPDMPEEGQDLAEHIQEKYGSTPEQSADSRQLLKAVGLTLGVEINYLQGSRIVNTFRAHQLLHWAQPQGKQTELEMALFEAYFSQGRNLNDVMVLKQAARKVGLDAEEAEAVLQDGRYKHEVRVKEAGWLQRGVRAVPTFVFGEKFAMSGAREPAEIRALLQRLVASGELQSI